MKAKIFKIVTNSEVKNKSKTERRIGNYKKDNEGKEKTGNNSGEDYREREENDAINTNNPRIFENINKKGNINKAENINRPKTKNKMVNVENKRRNRNSNQHSSHSSNIKAKKRTLQRLRIGTLNVRTLKSNDNLNELEVAFEDLNIDILGMAEVRKFGERFIVTKKNLLHKQQPRAKGGRFFNKKRNEELYQRN